MQTVAVTGGNGFIGRHLISRLTERGILVRLLTRDINKTQRLWPNPIFQIIRGDLTGPENELAPLIDGVDILFHCAGEIRNESLMDAVHVNGTQKLCQVAKGQIKHWIQLSSVGVYGPHREGLITEKTPLNPQGIYEITKAQSDQIVIDAADKGTFDYTILRPSIIFGPDMTNQSLFQMISMINKGFFFFIGKSGTSANYIHVDNVVDALVLCLKKEARNNIYNLSDHREIENIVTEVATELNRPMPKLRLSETLIRQFAKIMGKIPRFPLTESRVDALTNRSIYSIEKITSELGYEHKILMENGLHQMVRAWKNRSSDN